MEALAFDLRGRHLDLTENLTQERPMSAEEQVKIEAMEFALKDLESRPPFAPLMEPDEGA